MEYKAKVQLIVNPTLRGGSGALRSLVVSGTRMYRVMSMQSGYPNTVGKKVGERSDGMIVLECKRGRKHTYPPTLPENLELVRLPLARPGEKRVSSNTVL